jgi:hypothetical protein
MSCCGRGALFQVLGFTMLRCRILGMRRIIRTSGYRWGVALSGASLQKHLRVWKGTRISLGTLFIFLRTRWSGLIFRSFMADKIMPLTEAVEGYDIFDKMKVQKVVFEAQK